MIKKIFVSALASMTFATHGADAVWIGISNHLALARPHESIEVDWSELHARLPDISPDKVTVRDEHGLELACQPLDDNGDGQPDRLLFQADFASNAARRFEIVKSAPAQKQPARTFGRFVPERADDFAWENDRIAFRMYGPAPEKLTPPSSSGVDVWCKRTRALIVNAWYKSGDYHRDHGEGADFYSVGTGRGCGGVGIWQDGKLAVSRNFRRSRVVATGPIRVEFELDFEAWAVTGGTVTETKRISLDAGENLCRFSSTFTSEQTNLLVAIGLAKHDAKSGHVQFNQAEGWASVWGKLSSGHLGTGVVLPAAQVREVRQDAGHAYVLTLLAAKEKLVYYAGAGWDLSGDFSDEAAWERALRQRAQRIAAPLRVDWTAR
jgi:hypothetical protein